MGVQACSCRATVNATGTFPIPVLSFEIPVDYTLAIDICPECDLANSTVVASLFIDLPDYLPLPDEISVTFEGTPVGLPDCDAAEGTLSVVVEGTLNVNGNESTVTVTLVLNGNTGEVCIELENPLPIIGDSICIDVGDIVIESCEL